MMLMHVLACAAMLPVLVVAERYFFGGCGANFDNSVAPIAHTEQGYQTLRNFAATGAGKLYLWHPLNKEKDQKITSLKLLMGRNLDTFALDYKKAGLPVTISGTMTYQYTPKLALLLTSSPTSSGPEGIFSFDNKGVADLYPLSLTKTDIVLRGCVGSFLGRLESVYVLTNQNYTSLDSTCARQTIKSKFDNWEVVDAPQ